VSLSLLLRSFLDRHRDLQTSPILGAIFRHEPARCNKDQIHCSASVPQRKGPLLEPKDIARGRTHRFRFIVLATPFIYIDLFTRIICLDMTSRTAQCLVIPILCPVQGEFSLTISLQGAGDNLKLSQRPVAVQWDHPTLQPLLRSQVSTTWTKDSRFSLHSLCQLLNSRP
jgi:hypothetical protein